MIAVWASAGWPERLAPEPAGAAGLALGLLVIVVLSVHQMRPHWREKEPPGAVLARMPAREVESLWLYWASSTVLLVLLAVVVVERIVVLT